MKNVNWNKCKNLPTVIGPYLPKKGKFMENPETLKIIPNMDISAEYKECIVSMNIISETAANKYKAKVTGIRHSGQGKPDDLKIDDEVSIDREFICSYRLP